MTERAPSLIGPYVEVVCRHGVKNGSEQKECGTPPLKSRGKLKCQKTRRTIVGAPGHCADRSIGGDSVFR